MVILMSFRGERKKLDLGKYSLVIYERWGKKFEVIVDPRAALRYLKGDLKDPDEVIIYPEVYTDAQKGIKAPIDDLKKLVIESKIKEVKEKRGVLSKEDKQEIYSKINDLEDEKLKELALYVILKDGELQLPKSLREELLEKKKKQIVSYIQKYAVNPVTKAPYSPQKIREIIQSLLYGEAIEGKRIRVMLDPLKDISTQLPQIISALKTVIPIRLEIITAKVTIAPQYTGKIYSRLESLATIKESIWKDDGSLEAIVEVPGGIFVNFNREILNLTKGSAKVEVVKREVIG